MATVNKMERGCSTNPLCLRLHGGRTVCFMIIAVFVNALQTIVFRYIEGISTIEAVFFTRVVVFLSIVPTLVYLGETPGVDNWERLILLSIGAITHSVATLMFFVGLSQMRAGDVTAISLTFPVFVGIFGRIFLKNPFTLIDLALAGVNFAGVVLIAQPSFIFGDNAVDDDDVSGMLAYQDPVTATLASRGEVVVSTVAPRGQIAATLAPLAALSSSVAFASWYLLTRRMGILGISSFVVIFYSSVFGCALLGGMTTLFSGGWTMPQCGSERYALWAVGSLMFLALCLLIYSYARGRSFLLAILNTNEVTVAYLLEYMFFGVIPDPVAFLGAAMIMAASIGVSLKRTDWFNSRRTCRRGTAENHHSSESPDHVEMSDGIPVAMQDG